MLYYQYHDYIHRLDNANILNTMELYQYNPESIGFSYMLWHYKDIPLVVKQLAKDNFIVVLAMVYEKIAEGDFVLSTHNSYLWGLALRDKSLESHITRGNWRADAECKEAIVSTLAHQFIQDLAEDELYLNHLYFSLELSTLEEYTQSLRQKEHKP